MSEVTPPAVEPQPGSAWDRILHRAIDRFADLAGGLTRAQRAALLSLVVLVVALSLAFRYVTSETPPILIVLIGLICGTVPLVTYPRDGIPSALVVFAFTLGALFLLRPGIAGSPGGTGAAPRPVGTAEVERSEVELSGHVYDRVLRRFVEGAQVRVSGYGARTDSTDAFGGFEITVPKHLLRKDSVAFIVRTNVDTVFRRAVADGPFDLQVGSAPAVAAVAGQGGEVFPVGLSMRLRAGRPGQDRKSGGGLRVIVDSIRTLSAGPSGPSRWKFELEIDDSGDYDVPTAEYSAAPGREWMLVGGERRFAVPEGGVVELEIEGSRRGKLFASYGVRGSVRIALDSLRPDVPTPVRVDAVGSRGPAEGRFLFHLTLIREPPARRAVQRQRRPSGTG